MGWGRGAEPGGEVPELGGASLRRGACAGACTSIRSQSFKLIVLNSPSTTAVPVKAGAAGGRAGRRGRQRAASCQRPRRRLQGQRCCNVHVLFLGENAGSERGRSAVRAGGVSLQWRSIVHPVHHTCDLLCAGAMDAPGRPIVATMVVTGLEKVYMLLYKWLSSCDVSGTLSPETGASGTWQQ